MDKQWPRRALILAVICNYCAFICLDVFGAGMYWLSDSIKFMSITLCLALAISGYERTRSGDCGLLIAALALTATADALLLFTGLYAQGVGVFCLAHLAYLKRHKPGLNPAMLLALAAAALIMGFTGLLAPVCGLYAALILSAAVTSFTAGLPYGQKRYARLGMILFLLCDIHVAAHALLPPAHFYHDAALTLAWVFYLPSQLMLALSSPRRAGKTPQTT